MFFSVYMHSSQVLVKEKSGFHNIIYCYRCKVMRLKGVDDKEFSCHACANDHRHFLNNLSTYLSPGLPFYTLISFLPLVCILCPFLWCVSVQCVCVCVCVCVLVGVHPKMFIVCVCVPGDLSYSAPVMVPPVRWDLSKYVFKTTPPAQHITTP